MKITAFVPFALIAAIFPVEQVSAGPLDTLIQRIVCGTVENLSEAYLDGLTCTCTGSFSWLGGPQVTSECTGPAVVGTVEPTFDIDIDGRRASMKACINAEVDGEDVEGCITVSMRRPRGLRNLLAYEYEEDCVIKIGATTCDSCMVEGDFPELPSGVTIDCGNVVGLEGNWTIEF